MGQVNKLTERHNEFSLKQHRQSLNALQNAHTHNCTGGRLNAGCWMLLVRQNYTILLGNAQGCSCTNRHTPPEAAEESQSGASPLAALVQRCCAGMLSMQSSRKHNLQTLQTKKQPN